MSRANCDSCNYRVVNDPLAASTADPPRINQLEAQNKVLRECVKQLADCVTKLADITESVQRAQIPF